MTNQGVYLSAQRPAMLLLGPLLGRVHDRLVSMHGINTAQSCNMWRSLHCAQGCTRIAAEDRHVCQKLPNPLHSASSRKRRSLPAAASAGAIPYMCPLCDQYARSNAILMGCNCRSQAVFFDNKDYSGGSQTFPANVPAKGCSPCTELVRPAHCSVTFLAQAYIGC